MLSDAYLDAGVRGWIVTTARSNLWRVGEWYELEDLIQDGYTCYYKCHTRYTFLTVKKHPFTEDKRRFMALVQAAFNNHITTLANKRTAVPERPMSQQLGVEESEADAWTRIQPPQPAEEVSLGTLLAQAPSEIVDLLKALAKDTGDAAEFLRSRLRRKIQADGSVRVQRQRRRLRETTNEQLCRLIGLDAMETDLVSKVQAYLEA